MLTFSPTVDVNEVSVNIIDDDIHENSETFFGLLDSQDPSVITNPERATVTITDDNDRKLLFIVFKFESKVISFPHSAIVIGFERTEYNVSEGEQTEVCAVLTSGTLEKNVEVSVTSSDVTANGKCQ